MIKKMVTVDTFQFDATVGLKGAMAGLSQELQLGASESSETKIAVSGQADTSNDDDVKYLANLGIDFQSEGSDLNLNLDLLTTNEATFVKVNNAPQIELVDFSQLKDTWYKFQAEVSDASETEEDSLSASEVRKIRKLFQKVDFLKVVEDYGQEDLNGVRTYHYRVALNGEELKRFFVELKTIVDGQEPSLDEFKEIKANLDKWNDVSGDVWIGVKDYYLYKVNVGTNIDDVQSDLERFDLSLTLTNYGQPVDIQVPENAKVFDWNEVMAIPNVTVPEFSVDDLEKQLETLNLSDRELKELQKQMEEFESLGQ